MSESPSVTGKRKRLSEEEKEAKKRETEALKEARKVEKDLLQQAALDPPIPDVKTVTVNDQLLFICSFTGMTLTARYSVPVPGRNKKVRFQGSFLNPTAAFGWIRQTQKIDTVLFYEELLWKDMQAADPNANKLNLTECPPSSHLIRFGGTLTDEKFKFESAHAYWTQGLSLHQASYDAPASQASQASVMHTMRGWQTAEEFAATRLAKASEKPSKKPPPKRPRVCCVDADDEIIPYDCRKIESPVVAVPVSPEKFYKAFLGHFDRDIKDIPFVNLVEEDKPTDLILIYDASDDDQSKQMTQFTKWYNDGVPAPKKSRVAED